jgi:Uma2 family endonuclease
MTIATSKNTQPLLLNVSNTVLHITPEEFDSLCIDNPDLKLELTKDQELIIMPPTGGESGKRNSELIFQVTAWNKQTKLGEVFDSSTGYNFIPIGGGRMSPDVSWIEKSRLDGVDLTGFIPIVPDFIIELRSATDKLKPLQNKMLEYQRLTVKLGLLINPQDQQVEIYRLGQNVEILDSPTSINCDLVMPGFNLDLTEIISVKE